MVRKSSLAEQRFVANDVDPREEGGAQVIDLATRNVLPTVTQRRKGDSLGLIAGIAIAFAFTLWLDDSGVARTVALEGAHELGSNQAGTIQMALTALLGAGIGLAVARWLSTVAE